MTAGRYTLECVHSVTQGSRAITMGRRTIAAGGVMTAISGAMAADLAEAVRSMPCGACQAPRGEHCSGEGTHLARWELAAASALVSPQEYLAAAGRRPVRPAGVPAGPGCGTRDVRRGVHGGRPHPLQWAAGVQPPRWVHLDPSAGPSCAGPAVPRPATGEPCRYHRRHWLLSIPAVTVAGTVPACQRCGRKHARRERKR